MQILCYVSSDYVVQIKCPGSGARSRGWGNENYALLFFDNFTTLHDAISIVDNEMVNTRGVVADT